MPRPTIIGDAPFVERIITGLHSFDHAFINHKGELGFPVGKGIEIFGATHCGKSTIVYGLAGMIAGDKNIALADLEGFDPQFLGDVLETVGYEGIIKYIEEDGDEEILDSLIVVLRDENYSVGILDSIGAISPISEREGDLGEANMGRRAFLMAQFSRKFLKLMRDHYPKTLFMVNHAYQRIGGMGLTTPGGNVKNYISSIRIKVKRRYWKKKDKFPDGSYILDGQVVKNRWGHKDLNFALFVLSGRGIHHGLTAMFDCVDLGLTTSERVIKIGDKSFGRMKKITDEAQQGNEEFFQPFIELLNPTNDENQGESENE